jgi:hypothetical protein
MANYLQLNGTHDLQEIYSSIAQPILGQTAIFNQLLNRRWNEEARKGGSLKIPILKLTDVIEPYDIIKGKKIDQSVTQYKTVVIDKEQGINIQIDGHESSMLSYDLVQQTILQAVEEVAIYQELKSIKAFIIGPEAGTASTQSAVTDKNVYENITKDITQLVKLGFIKSQIKVAVSPDCANLLVLDPRYGNSSSEIGAGFLRYAVMKPIYGVESYEVPLMFTADPKLQYIVFGQRSALTFDWFKKPLQINNLTNEFINSSALQGRINYTNALLNRTHLIYNNK